MRGDAAFQERTEAVGAWVNQPEVDLVRRGTYGEGSPWYECIELSMSSDSHVCYNGLHSRFGLRRNSSHSPLFASWAHPPKLSDLDSAYLEGLASAKQVSDSQSLI